MSFNINHSSSLNPQQQTSVTDLKNGDETRPDRIYVKAREVMKNNFDQGIELLMTVAKKYWETKDCPNNNEKALLVYHEIMNTEHSKNIKRLGDIKNMYFRIAQSLADKEKPIGYYALGQCAKFNITNDSADQLSDTYQELASEAGFKAENFKLESYEPSILSKEPPEVSKEARELAQRAIRMREKYNAEQIKTSTYNTQLPKTTSDTQPKKSPYAKDFEIQVSSQNSFAKSNLEFHKEKTHHVELKNTSTYYSQWSKPNTNAQTKTSSYENKFETDLSFPNPLNKLSLGFHGDYIPTLGKPTNKTSPSNDAKATSLDNKIFDPNKTSDDKDIIKAPQKNDKHFHLKASETITIHDLDDKTYSEFLENVKSVDIKTHFTTQMIGIPLSQMQNRVQKLKESAMDTKYRFVYADQNDDMTSLAAILLYGPVEVRDLSMGVFYATKAANYGSFYAQAILGMVYMEGIPELKIKADKEKGYQYLKKFQNNVKELVEKQKRQNWGLPSVSNYTAIFKWTEGLLKNWKGS